MEVIHDLTTYNGPPSVITLGVFDGVHKGHRMLIDETLAFAAKVHLHPIVVTFWPHPKLVLAPNAAPSLLSTYSEKLTLLESTGLPSLVILPFSKEFAGLSSREFIEDILFGKLKMRHLLIGHDHKFGSDRQNGLEHYQKIGQELGFSISRAASLDQGGLAISSTRIRQLLQSGAIKEANKLLKHPYLISGEVISGKQIGRKIGFPTANVAIEMPWKLIPAKGVYAVWAKTDYGLFKGMLNIGYRPTVDINSKVLSVEVHLINFAKNLYSRHITLYFMEHIRPEMKFSGLEALKNQLKEDRQNIEQILQTHPLNI